MPPSIRTTCLLLWLLLALAGCGSPEPAGTAVPARRPAEALPPTVPPARTELVPEPDRNERLQAEALAALRHRDCVLADPDTSVAGICLHDAGSLARVLGARRRPDQDGRYFCYSRNEHETLTLIPYEGGYRDEMSLFQVAYSDKASHAGYLQLPVASFRTEKGIGLGLTKAQVLARLGTCCAHLDSTATTLTLRYQLDPPQDSRTRLVGRHNEAGYYATYDFRHDRLTAFAFGFVYP